VGDPGGDRLPGLVGQLELHRLPGLVLQDDGAMGNGAALGDVTDAMVDPVAAAQLAVDGEVEEGEVAQLIGELRADPDGPDLAQLQRRLSLPLFRGVRDAGVSAVLVSSDMVWMPRRQDVRRRPPTGACRP